MVKVEVWKSWRNDLIESRAVDQVDVVDVDCVASLSTKVAGKCDWRLHTLIRRHQHPYAGGDWKEDSRGCSYCETTSDLHRRDSHTRLDCVEDHVTVVCQKLYQTNHCNRLNCDKLAGVS